MIITKTDKIKEALAEAFVEAMEYGDDDAMAGTDIDSFVKLHIEDFREMVADYVAEKVI